MRNCTDEVGKDPVALTVVAVASTAAADAYEVVPATKVGVIAPVDTEIEDNVASVAALTTVVPVVSTAKAAIAATKNFARCFMVRFVSFVEVVISYTSSSFGFVKQLVVQP